MALGQSSKVVSLPHEWLRLNKLNRGDTVLVRIQRDGSLVIRPTTEIYEEVKQIHLQISVDESDESIVRKIIGTYLDGYTHIILKSGNIFTALPLQFCCIFLRGNECRHSWRFQHPAFWAPS